MSYPFTNDDFDRSVSSEVGIMPQPQQQYFIPIGMSFFNDPLIAAEIDNMVQTAELKGYDLTNPEMLGSWLTDMFSKVKGAVSGIKDVKITTPLGITQVGEGGVSYTSSQQQQPAAVPAIAPAAGTQKGLTEYLKNPYVVAAIVGIPVLLILLKKRRKTKDEN